MIGKISPLAPKTHPRMPALVGVSLAAVEAGIKYKGRKDLAAILFDKPAQIAGVFTQSKCASAPVDWCRMHIERGTARAIVINSGNANAFTGKTGWQSAEMTANAASAVFGCKTNEVFLASTGVIGEPLDATDFETHLARAGERAGKRADEATGSDSDQWNAVARAMMTTDTYFKTSTRSFDVDGRTYHLNGMAKGSGMIQPDMATMLAFLVTDLPVAAELLQKMLKRAIGPSFNSITVDSDTSTSDTVLLASAANGARLQRDARGKGMRAFRKALQSVLHELAMLVVRDGEGASKHVEVTVTGAKSVKSAKRIAFAVANSPLVKTAIAGEDANWGRIVMAVGKAGEPADRDRINIHFGSLRVAHKGARDPNYNEEEASAVMREEFIQIRVDVGVGKSAATVWTCDLTADYVAINADYRS